MRRLLVTGGSGFVGGEVCRRAVVEGWHVAAAVRGGATPDAGVQPFHFEALDRHQDWAGGLAGTDVVIHCAARVHVMDDQSPDPLAEFRKVNVEGTLALARQAAAAGVKRFIFISSIKVNGEGTVPGAPYTCFDEPKPQDPYGISKMEAEQGLRAIAEQTGLEVIIIRPVLVYGPGVKANFRSMMSWLSKGAPLPLGAIRNKRSLVSLDNLVDLIMTCVEHPAAANQTFLVSDGHDLSTTEMLQRMGVALNRPARLLPVPAGLLELGAALLGKRAVAQRLCGSLQVDIRHTCQTLNWSPPVSVDQGFRSAATAFLNE